MKDETCPICGFKLLKWKREFRVDDSHIVLYCVYESADHLFVMGAMNVNAMWLNKKVTPEKWDDEFDEAKFVRDDEHQDWRKDD